MQLSFDDGYNLLKKAYEQKVNDLLMQRWMLHYQNEISFEEFKDKLNITVTYIEQSEESILTDVKGILETFNKGVK